MKITKYGFILKGPGYKQDVHTSQIENPLFSSRVVCVSSVEEGCEAAQKMVDEGVQLIELCGGFGEDASERIINSIKGKVPVGYVTFSENEMNKLIEIKKE